MDNINDDISFDQINLFYVNKNENIDSILNHVALTFPDMPKEIFDNAKKYYHQDQRSLGEITQEIHTQIGRIYEMERLVNREIPKDVLDQSYLFIGPMGVGKSTIAQDIARENSLDLVSLDNREKLNYLYKDRDKFNFKDFEFYITATVLTSLDKPSVVDFGAGHSIYENPVMFYEMSKLIKRFKNVIYLLPSMDKEESLAILEERLRNRNVKDIGKTLNNNRHFIEMPCNESLATKTIFTANKSVEDIKKEVLKYSKGKRLINEQSGFVDYIILSLLVGFVVGVVAALSYVFISS